MSEFAAVVPVVIERVRTLMVERGYDAIVVRDEANLRWLTGVKGVFDYTSSSRTPRLLRPISACSTPTRAISTALRRTRPPAAPGSTTWTRAPFPARVAGKIAANKCRVCAVEDDMQINFYQGIQRGLEDRSVACMLPLMHDDIRDARHQGCRGDRAHAPCAVDHRCSLPAHARLY